MFIKDTHALPGPAQRTALEVLAANDVETAIQRSDEVTPTPVISRAILVHNRGRVPRLADGIVATPSYNPPEDGGFKHDPSLAGPQTPTSAGANELLCLRKIYKLDIAVVTPRSIRPFHS